MTISEVARDIQLRIEANYGQPIDGYIVTMDTFRDLRDEFEFMRHGGPVVRPPHVLEKIKICGVEIIPMA